jgi:hypothetical protein
MKRRWQRAIIYMLAGSILFTQSGCMGSFNLTKKLYEWNNSVSGDKFVNNLVFWMLSFVLPAYSIALFLDAVIFNLVEFWTGSNPVAMKEGEVKIQMVSKNGKDYKFIATKNQIEVINLTDNETAVFNYRETDKTWYLTDGEKTAKLFTENEKTYTVYINEQVVEVEKNTNGMAYLEAILTNNLALK